MTWGELLQKSPSRAQEQWTTNQDVAAAWERHVRKRGAKNSQRNLITYVGVFLRSFGDLVTTLEPDDIEAFVTRISSKCAKLIHGKRNQCLAKQDITTCPVILGQQPYSACPRYQALEPSGVWSYVCAINRFYEWLCEEGRVARNPCLPVMRDYASRHSAFFKERRRKPRRRVLSLDEVRLLITRSPIHYAIGFMLMTKCFLRIHEVLKLSWDKEHCNLEEQWMDLPASWDLGGKRLGNPPHLPRRRIVALDEALPRLVGRPRPAR